MRIHLGSLLVGLTAGQVSAADRLPVELTFSEMKLCYDLSERISEFSNAALLAARMLNEETSLGLARSMSLVDDAEGKIEFVLPSSIATEISMIGLLQDLYRKYSDFVQSALSSKEEKMSDSDRDYAIALSKDAGEASRQVLRICQDAYPRRDM